jgi:hypothetical protein
LIISAALLGCSSPAPERCGPGSDATEFGLATGSAAAASYGDLVAMQNNDCPDPSAPSGIVSLTLLGTEQGGGGIVNLCIPRPDLLAHGEEPLGSGAARVELTDLTGSSNSCSFSLDTSQPITGTVTADGLCGEGSAGFSLTVSGSLTVSRHCGSATDSVPISLGGSVIVSGS